MQIFSMILGITGGAIGLIISLAFFISPTQIPGLSLLAICLSIIGILSAILTRNKPKIGGVLMLIVGISFIGMNSMLRLLLLSVPFLIIGGLLSLAIAAPKLKTIPQDQYKINYFLKTFLLVIIVLSFLKAISLTISYYSVDAEWKAYWYLGIFFSGIIVIIYSAFYTLSNKIYKFSLKYSAIYNFLLGALLIINTILFYKIKIDWTYKIFLLFITMQIFIALWHRAYKKVPRINKLWDL